MFGAGGGKGGAQTKPEEEEEGKQKPRDGVDPRLSPKRQPETKPNQTNRGWSREDYLKPIILTLRIRGGQGSCEKIYELTFGK